ncbi:MAG: TatD family hydrolase, partial [Candidatus Pacebacteria bacterium]|nr:TatD family hydrolase [Candidatus Paceibacterota bacterium]
MKFQFVDIHTHVNFAAFEKDREEIIQRALDARVAMINVGTQVDTSRKAIEMVEKYENCYAIVGLHPVHTSKSFHDEKELSVGGKEFTSRGETFDTAIYRSMLKHPKVVGIGECGLDYYHLDEESIKIQQENFEMQIDLANESGKPLMLHVRSNKESGKSAYKDAL